MAAPPVQTTTIRRRGQPLVLPLLFVLTLHHCNVASANQYKVGDLDAWGVPPPGNSQLYSAWSLSHHFKIGDSLLFLYPPSQDSVVQVTEVAFNTCSVGEPILKMGDGNSLFNITSPGEFYFTSGVPGHCQKHQRLHISVPSGNGTFFPPSAAEAPAGALSASSPAYPTVFGPAPPSSASPSQLGGSVKALWGLLGLLLLSS
ncbi:hypothetical protein Taro_043224 [Colocasia esculenta]|uniref:Phytocyanin domain-containing protein n=1 Tax=Colocasia esculenta TaxID=4460 RepID=A0A843WQV1_COLES|nr:hypothetical protein [Colocasia esculenta]